MFLTFEEYTKMGFNAIDEADFPRLSMLAEDDIVYKTRRRARLGTEYDTDLKKATALIAEDMHTEEKSSVANALKNGAGGVINSESNDGFSISYQTIDTHTEAAQAVFKQNRDDILRRYLLHTGWLYAGVGTCR